ncbi:hypothetical protein DXE03_19495 [Vibrio parahaemolyticus]|nr:hypothetical protein DXE03_19495 [Vibrio parahaemolyticus]
MGWLHSNSKYCNENLVCAEFLIKRWYWSVIEFWGAVSSQHASQKKQLTNCLRVIRNAWHFYYALRCVALRCV